MPLDQFADRHAAGRELAGLLAEYGGRTDVIVLGLPRGGVPVAFEVARALAAPLDVCVVRKLGVPKHEELAFGAIAGGGVRVLNEDVVSGNRLQTHDIDAVTEREQRELERREQLYRGGRPALNANRRTAIVVDDGLATGATMRAAIVSLRARHAARIVVAVPIASYPSCRAIAEFADATVWAHTPEPFVAVGLWYADFAPTSDAEVRDLLHAAGGGSR